jgi:hypothetical protein
MYLTTVTETYRMESESEVEDFLQEMKADHRFTIAKYSSTKKEIKSKGEVVDSYFRLTITKIFNEEKEPEHLITINYERN